MDAASRALVRLGRTLQELGYEFVTVTPETHARVLARDARPARSLRDVFGWSRPFTADVVPEPLLEIAREARAVVEDDGRLRATVRFSSLGARLFVHSAFPTRAPDSVFFGPDTYRFCAFVTRVLPRPRRVVDVGCGSGAGGIAIAGHAGHVVLADVNPRALDFARVNAALAGADVEIVESDVLSGIAGTIDAVIANPPYLKDAARRTYRDGGGRLGEALSLRIVREALARLEPNGTLVLYTGAPVVDGEDVFRRAAEAACREADATFRYEELDPDVFGDELDEPAYRGVERIAAIGLVARVPGAGGVTGRA